MSVHPIDTKRKSKANEAAERNRQKVNAWYAKNRKIETADGFRSHCVICGDEFFAPRRGVKVCGEGGCAKVIEKIELAPFTVEHFEAWAGHVVLDTDELWQLEDFHRLYLEDLFAGVDSPEAKPTYSEAWLLIGEGNTKTTFFAGIALYHIQHRRSGRVPVAASTRDQAFELFLQAQGMVERSPDLFPIFTCHEGLRTIKCESQASRVQVYAADDRSGDGVIFTLALVDELHRHRDLRLYRTWAGKTQKRGGQIAVISTAGAVGEEFEATRDRMRQLATKRAELKPGFLRAESARTVLHEYAVPEKIDGKKPNYEDMNVAKLANPFSGITVESLQEKRDSPTMTLGHWLRLTCNIAARSANAGVSEIEWNRQYTTVRIPPGVPIWAGLDVAWRRDTTALVPLWIRDFEFRLLGPATILTPPRDGTSLDPDLVEAALLNLNETNPIHTLVMDTTKAEQLSVWAERELGCEVIDRGQSNALQAMDYEKWTEGLREQLLWHSGDPGLTKHVLTAIAIDLPGGKTRFDRPQQTRGGNQEQQERRVIDALTAAGMAHGVAAAELSDTRSGGGVVYAS